MNEKKNGSAFSDTDGFWNLDSLLPRSYGIPKRQSADVRTVEISCDAPSSDSSPYTERYAPVNESADDSHALLSSEGYAVDPLTGEVVSQKSASNAPTETRYKSSYPPINTAPKPYGGAQRIDFELWLKERYSASAIAGRTSPGDTVNEYTPANPLFTSVRVIKHNAPGKLSERMMIDMREMLGKTEEFTGNIPFSAFYPQYAKMTKEQVRCYLGFRASVNRGDFPDVDESYIYLLLYEIINLPKKIPPKQGIELICSLMLAYRDCSDGLFTNMCDWLCDYCLINQAEAPMERLSQIRERVCKCAGWKEFFIPFNTDILTLDACVIMSAASSYDYRFSHYYTPKTAALFDRHIQTAFNAAILAISQKESRFSEEKRETTRLTHEAFRGALCSANVRYTVSVECVCFTRSALVRQTATNLIKYAENHVRELLGIKSRLTVSYLSDEKKQPIRDYFSPFLIHRKSELQQKKQALHTDAYEEKKPDYEQYYEPPKEDFSAERAKEIENDSWKITELLLSVFNGQEEENTAFLTESVSATANGEIIPTDTEANSSDSPISQATETPTSDNSPVITALSHLLSENLAAFRGIAASLGILPETLADQINELAIECYGDIAIEADGSFAIIEDYREELSKIVNCTQ